MSDLEDLDLEAARQMSVRRAGGDSICAGCQHSRTYRRRSQPYPAIYCNELYRHVPPDIVECSEFVAIATLTLEQMQQIALAVDPRPGISDGSYR
jgi:hypothetical protein